MSRRPADWLFPEVDRQWRWRGIVALAFAVAGLIAVLVETTVVPLFAPVVDAVPTVRDGAPPTGAITASSRR